jgi:hypothetical protein
MLNFDICAGSVQGTDHKRIGKPNQDAFHYIKTDDIIIGTVTDGCGSTPFAEVGAKLGARLFNNELWTELNLGFFGVSEDEHSFKLELNYQLELLSKKIESTLYNLIRDIQGIDNLNVVAHKYFLFTIVSIIITKHFTAIVTMGDGFYNINGEDFILESENNAPDYITYKLLYPEFNKNFTVQRVIPTQNLKGAIVGTDGCTDIITSQHLKLNGGNDF